MTTIRLGTGADAVDVEDGASVPMTEGQRGNVFMGGGLVCVRWGSVGSQAVSSVDGPSGELHSWHLHIDLAALRRERAPKSATVGGWTNGVFKEPTAHNLYGSTVLNLFQRADGELGATYWTHRPGNTPELQAAFDAAVEAYASQPLGYPDRDQIEALRAAAHALGYGVAPR